MVCCCCYWKAANGGFHSPWVASPILPILQSFLHGSLLPCWVLGGRKAGTAASRPRAKVQACLCLVMFFSEPLFFFEDDWWGGSRCILHTVIHIHICERDMECWAQFPALTRYREFLKGQVEERLKEKAGASDMHWLGTNSQIHQTLHATIAHAKWCQM